MVETIMYFGLGFLTASLIGLVLFSVFFHRIVGRVTSEVAGRVKSELGSDEEIQRRPHFGRPPKE